MTVDNLHLTIENLIEEIVLSINEKDTASFSNRFDQLLNFVKNDRVAKHIVEDNIQNYDDYLWCDDIMISIIEYKSKI